MMSAGTSRDSKNENVLFSDLNGDDDPEVTEIESLCMQCGENGVTKLLLTKIPFYKEVVIMSFSCEHCQWENNELQPASKIQENGITYRLTVKNQKDLTRTVVKTEWASVMIPELEFEIPSKSQEGAVTNIEGVIERTCAGLNSKLQYLKVKEPNSAIKLEEFLSQLEELKSGSIEFTFVLRDCSGNSFLENLHTPKPDPHLQEIPFERSREEDMMLGIYMTQEEDDKKISDMLEKSCDLRDEVLGLPTNCYSCNAPCITNMKLTQIPHFTDVVIMCTVCESCGHKTNEVKSGSGIQPFGVRFTLEINEHKDLTRDVLKSDSCRLVIKELELDVGPAAFGSRFSTVEGLLTNIKEQLLESNPFISGDSADLMRKGKMESFLKKIDEIIAGERKVTFVMDDPCGNSYMQSITTPEEDINLVVDQYQRSTEQDEELGLLDMKVEGYENDS